MQNFTLLCMSTYVQICMHKCMFVYATLCYPHCCPGRAKIRHVGQGGQARPRQRIPRGDKKTRLIRFGNINYTFSVLLFCVDSVSVAIRGESENLSQNPSIPDSGRVPFPTAPTRNFNLIWTLYHNVHFYRGREGLSFK